MTSVGRVMGPVGWLWNLLEGSVAIKIAVKALGRVWGPKRSCEISRKSLGNSRIAMKSIGRVSLQTG